MSGSPWMKFYPRDWRGDQALRAVSIGARGLWMECLCIMHEAEPYGHLLLNGEIPGDDALARMTGTSVDELREHLAELRQAGVLSVTRKGIITSRRMIKDFSKAQKGTNAVNKRWSQVTETTEKKDGPNRSPNRVPTHPPNTQKPESRIQKEDASLRSASAPRGKQELDGIEARCRQAAGLVDDASPSLLDLSPIRTLLDKGWSLETDILPVLRSAEARGKRGRTWLYYVRMVEEAKAKNDAIGRPPPSSKIPADQAWRNKILEFKRSGLWLADWGERPGSAGCQVPADILIEFGYGQPKNERV
ncbi:hypothetical protein OSH11_11790 [Kaistia dalseonensis]|uniref:Transcriptional regulator n=1 Tax=Kaistia dalseonensis TaxID=410840 RepID=A0ABU0H6N6_9HYPH|nr:hypothetical protein [Kaistia dalseonensis]MCX5495390.1 hypothetical protein [Kaistia dalseonensis]MDQ0437978.1 putative transcriptional regulator [Kaistia dalseonensis]